MKISFWQQFSSNHSANFMVIGEFESAEWAAVVAEEIQDMLAEIGAWWEEYLAQFPTVHAQNDALEGYTQPTPPELKYQQQYHLIPWVQARTQRLDWIYDRTVVKSVTRHDRWVILNQAATTGDTWTGAYPINLIFEQLGGNVFIESEDSDRLHLNLSLTLPNVVTGEIIQNQVRVLNAERSLKQLGDLYPTLFDFEINDLTFKLKRYAIHYYYYYHALHQNKGKKGSNLPSGHGFTVELQRLLSFFEGYGCTQIQLGFE